MPAVRLLEARIESWPLAKPFVISRGAKTEARVVVVEVGDGEGNIGRGEAVPYARYGETPEGVVDLARANWAAYQTRPGGDLPDPPFFATQSEKLEGLGGCASQWGAGLAPRAQHVLPALPPGAARNALDCALWDLAAKRSGTPAHLSAGLATLAPVVTCYTLSLDTPAAMAQAAREVPHLPLIKLKLGGGADDADRMRAVRAARPEARLVADANEAWGAHELQDLLAVAASEGFELIEQPLPAGADAALAGLAHSVPICADESCHTTADLPRLAGRYDAINVKLDKAGGLTEALALTAAARTAGFRVMIGSMVATSLAVAPALILAQGADWVDLDGPLLLARDRVPGVVIRDGVILPPGRELWG